MPKYANSTTVSTEKSRMEIETVLRRYGADGFRYGWADRDGTRVEQIEFSANQRVVRFTLPMPSKSDNQFRYTEVRGNLRSESAIYAAWEQACRQRWRALCLAVKAKLECVECGISEFDNEFLSHIVDPESQKTVAEVVLPQINARYDGLPGHIGLPGLPDYSKEDA